MKRLYKVIACLFEDMGAQINLVQVQRILYYLLAFSIYDIDTAFFIFNLARYLGEMKVNA